MVLRSVGVLSCGKLMGTVYAALGLIFGAFVSLFSLVGAVAVHQEEGGHAALPMIFGVGSIVVFPIMYGIGGFIGGIISAAIYNLAAGVIGGLELDLQAPAAP